MPDELSVAEKGGGTVVVGVKESEGLLLEDEEDRVNEFEVLCEVVQLHRSAAEPRQTIYHRLT